MRERENFVILFNWYFNVTFLLAYYEKKEYRNTDVELVVLTRVNLNVSHKLQNTRIQMRSAQVGH
jgi:heme O synthase-like polyprenyltransferase